MENLEERKELIDWIKDFYRRDWEFMMLHLAGQDIRILAKESDVDAAIEERFPFNDDLMKYISNLSKKGQEFLNKMGKETIWVRRDYYGNKGYGKRVYWFVDEQGGRSYWKHFDYIFVEDFDEWKDEQEANGHEVIILK